MIQILIYRIYYYGNRRQPYMRLPVFLCPETNRKLRFSSVSYIIQVDGIELGDPPRELTKIVKCVKYYSYWEFDTKENYGKAIKFFFENYNKDLQKMLIAPFDINLGYSV